MKYPLQDPSLHFAHESCEPVNFSHLESKFRIPRSLFLCLLLYKILIKYLQIS